LPKGDGFAGRSASADCRVWPVYGWPCQQNAGSVRIRVVCVTLILTVQATVFITWPCTSFSVRSFEGIHAATAITPICTCKRAESNVKACEAISGKPMSEG
jgi:hypothetical protein